MSLNRKDQAAIIGILEPISSVLNHLALKSSIPDYCSVVEIPRIVD
ncbi:hypothetical protein AM1_B0048 (plasmid) [Acaryochloris marina MBIC11017]|uniref:Uncharacterized protein n=1 Tax=Acaryochloris marina (strain MBIC 11017) TaxID=329726 RepID=A8ZM06_ACAM1|nr:hypothetical protein AM1_B0048 [Acaryochloris marina MBIC11017]